jgi:uncharacterized repeat protein (TIGR01451 family)
MVLPMPRSCHRYRFWWLALAPMISLVSSIAPTQAEPPAKNDLLPLNNEASYSFDGVNFPGKNTPVIRFEGTTNQVLSKISERLVDPFGRLTGCNGEPLTQYNGFSIALYDPSDATATQLGNLTSLTTTEVPDLLNNGIPKGLSPNNGNANPFYMSDGEGGRYNFLFDPAKGQLNSGRSYILVVTPPRNSIFSQRRIRIAINQRLGDVVSYTATALDGKPISSDAKSDVVGGVIQIGNAENTGLILSALSLATDVCQAQELQIIKTGDRAAAAPGDTVVYRLAVRNLSSTSLRDLTITDNLPVGFRYQEGSVRAELRGNKVAVTATLNDGAITFKIPDVDLPPAAVGQEVLLNLAYAATLTPDAIRGNGRNLALAEGTRTDNGRRVKDGPASHQLRIQRGLINDCGTILGRVFDDKNLDGEQQSGEPGIPNAVVFLDDGNRIMTDKDGLFSVANVLPGYRTGVLDFSSIPNYTLLPQPNFKERNSQSRLVKLAPNGLVRMNFAVTPINAPQVSPK